jgi:hypothetical protein
MSTRTLAKVPGGGMQMATGTYTGDGAATQAIVGLGFQPTAIIIYVEEIVPNNTGYYGVKADVDGLYAKVMARFDYMYELDHIISLDADGFTVGDGTGSGIGNILNRNTKIYTYVAFM